MTDTLVAFSLTPAFGISRSSITYSRIMSSYLVPCIPIHSLCKTNEDLRGLHCLALRNCSTSEYSGPEHLTKLARLPPKRCSYISRTTSRQHQSDQDKRTAIDRVSLSSQLGSPKCHARFQFSWAVLSYDLNVQSNIGHVVPLSFWSELPFTVPSPSTKRYSRMLS